MPRAQLQQAITRISADVPQAFGDRLVCLALYGSAANEAFVPERSDLNFAIVLKSITLEDLKSLQGFLPAWHRLGVATPLLIDIDFLQHARDVFPIELDDIRYSHRLLAGRDVFSELEIDRVHLRRQLEQEARGKLLRLRVQYAETGGKAADVEALMVDSVSSFLTLVRGALRMGDQHAPATPVTLIEHFEAMTGEPLNAVGLVARAKAGERLGAAADAVFREYLADVERLVRAIDRLPTFPRSGGRE